MKKRKFSLFHGVRLVAVVLCLLVVLLVMQFRSYAEGIRLKVAESNTQTVWIMANHLLMVKDYDETLTQDNFTEQVIEKLGSSFAKDQIIVHLSDDEQSVHDVTYIKDGFGCETSDGEVFVCGYY